MACIAFFFYTADVMNIMELDVIQNKIYEVRGTRVMLDFDLAKLYQVETKVLKQSVRRNLDRFPGDFMFELTENEYNSLIISLRSQTVTSNDKGGRRTCNIESQSGTSEREQRVQPAPKKIGFK